MSAAGDRFQAEVKALADRRRQEILAELDAAEPVGTPGPDETPELMAQMILEHEADRAAGVKMIPHEEVVRVILAPTIRWEAYKDDPATLPEDERESLRAAGALVEKELGGSPGARAYGGDAGTAVRVADVIALLVLQRELWEPGPRGM